MKICVLTSPSLYLARTMARAPSGAGALLRVIGDSGLFWPCSRCFEILLDVQSSPVAASTCLDNGSAGAERSGARHELGWWECCGSESHIILAGNPPFPMPIRIIRLSETTDRWRDYILASKIASIFYKLAVN